MIFYRVTGTCTKCGKFHKIEGISNEGDAFDIFHMEHMDNEGHWFEGESVTSTYEESSKVGKKYRGRR